MAYSMGIIGGADGPTAIFVTGNPVPSILGFALLAAAIILLILFFRNKK